MRRALLVLAVGLPLAPARADQLWIGAYRHDVALSSIALPRSTDIKGGWIGEPIAALRAIGSPSPHLLVSANLSGDTNYAAAGLNWRIGSIVYARPGIGLSVNDGKRPVVRQGRRVDLGSPVTFEPELAFGWNATPTLAIEASWIHLSHATLFSRQNRGLDSWGLRALVRLR